MKPAPEPEWSLRGHRDAVSSVRFVGEGCCGIPRLLASGDIDGQLKLWDLIVQRPLKEWAYPSNDGILEIHGHAGDRELLTQSRDGRIRLWDLERLASGAEPSDALSRTIFTDAFHFARCSVSSPSSSAESNEYLVLAPCDEMEAMCLWDTRADTYSQKLDLSAEGDSSSLGMAMSSKLVGSTLAVVGYESGDIIAFDLIASRVRARRTLFKSPVMGLDTDGERVYAAGVEPKARVCKLDGDKILTRSPQLPVNCESTEHAKDGVGQLMLRPDGKLFATAGWDYRLRLFSTRAPTFKPLAVLRYHSASINAITFSSDSTILAAGSKDFKISLWSDLYPPSRADREGG